MGIEVKVTPEKEVTQFTYKGRTYTVSVDRYGHLVAHPRYTNGVEISGYSVAALKQAMRNQDETNEAEREKQKRIAEARANPQPGVLLTFSGYEGIQVRGLDRRSGHVLITRAGGQKESARPVDVLRILNEGEAADLRTAQSNHKAARDRHAEAAAKGVETYSLGRSYDVNLNARYDVDTDTFRVDYDGKEFVVTGGDRGSYGLQEQIERYIIGRDFTHWASTHSGLIQEVTEALADKISGGALFHSLEDAQRYLDTHAAVNEAGTVVAQLRKEFAFDLSIFEDQK